MRRRGQRELVELGAISTVRARRNEVEIRHVAGRALYRSTLAAIAERLAPFGFLRVHRSLLVRSDAIVVLRRRRGGDAELLLVDGERIALSPKQARGLERAMAVASEGRDRVPRGAAGGGASRRGEAL